MEQTLYAVKSKKSGYYFQFVQYFEDGYGMYEANCMPPFDGDDMPHLFKKESLIEGSYVWREFKLSSHELKDHLWDEVEVIEVTLNFKE